MFVWLCCRERIRMQAAGKLQIAPGVEHDFTSDDLQDLGEIGRGAYGAVNKMIFCRTSTVMAGKNIDVNALDYLCLCACLCDNCVFDLTKLCSCLFL